MKRPNAFILAAAALLIPPFAPAVMAQASPAQAQAQDQQPIFGSQMMNQQERMQYRARMLSAQSDEERQQIRLQHHEQMRQRAAERGITLPDEPPMNPGHGMMTGGPMGGQGPGMGRGVGMGRGTPGGQGGN